MRLSDSDDRPPAAQAPAPTLQDRLGRGAWVNVPSLARKLEWAKGGCSFRVPFHPIRTARPVSNLSRAASYLSPSHWPGRLPSSWKCCFHAAFMLHGPHWRTRIWTDSKSGAPDRLRVGFDSRHRGASIEFSQVGGGLGIDSGAGTILGTGLWPLLKLGPCALLHWHSILTAVVRLRQAVGA